MRVAFCFVILILAGCGKTQAPPSTPSTPAATITPFSLKCTLQIPGGDTIVYEPILNADDSASARCARYSGSTLLLSGNAIYPKGQVVGFICWLSDNSIEFMIANTHNTGTEAFAVITLTATGYDFLTSDCVNQ